jgi:UDP-N-acetylmuramoyl-tripeptide--D-alanyl-D-alanine ligase
MQQVTLGWMAGICRGTLVGGSPQQKVTGGLCIDSRKIAAGDCFVALAGRQGDGHAFIAQAHAAGAAAALCRRAVEGVPCIRVSNPRQAMGAVAAAYRRKFKSLKVVGITGSSGKTTTKEMVCAVLGTRYKVHANQGNFNNDLGVPMTLTRLERTHTAAVIEMGMNHAGEIRTLARMAAPQVGVITNIGDAHRGHFRDRKALTKAKAELLAELPAQGMAVINLDDPNLATRGRDRRITFGINERADVRIEHASVHLKGTHVVLEYAGKKQAMWLKTYGAHQALNAAAAVATGLALKVPFEAACRALAKYRPQAMMRSQLIKIGPHHVIHDAYNSNPQSAAAAVRLLAELPANGQRIFVAGSMLELGDYSPEAHRQLGAEAAICGLQGLITVGSEARVMQERAQGIRRKAHVAVAEDVVKKLWPWLSPEGDLILVKGSRGLGLEKAVEALKQRFKV